MSPEQHAAIATLARYASAYPACLDGIAERLEHEGEGSRAKAYRTAFRDIQAAVDAARETLGI